MKAKLKKKLFWIATLGPMGLLVADKVAHLFGFCLGY